MLPFDLLMFLIKFRENIIVPLEMNSQLHLTMQSILIQKFTASRDQNRDTKSLYIIFITCFG